MVFIQKSFSVIGQFLKLLGGTMHSLHVKSSLIGQWGLLSAKLYLLLPAKLWEGNVFTNVCLSTGGYAISWLAAWSHFPSGYIPPGGLPGGGGSASNGYRFRVCLQGEGGTFWKSDLFGTGTLVESNLLVESGVLLWPSG